MRVSIHADEKFRRTERVIISTGKQGSIYFSVYSRDFFSFATVLSVHACSLFLQHWTTSCNKCTKNRIIIDCKRKSLSPKRWSIPSLNSLLLPAICSRLKCARLLVYEHLRFVSPKSSYKELSLAIPTNLILRVVKAARKYNALSSRY